MTAVAPRIFGIPAARAPIVAVLRRGPSDWSHVGRWDLARDVYTPGAWIRGNLYPQRCDLSPDGRLLCYFTLKQTATWDAGATYVAISRLPWLAALAAWKTCGTWTRGAHFVEDRTVWEVEPPDEGDAAPCRARFGLAVTRPASFAVERRRGWRETADSMPRDASDMWDERRADRVTMEKVRPTDRGTRLRVRGYFAAFRAGQPGPARDLEYEIVDATGTRPLAEAQWADWAADGRLLVATRDGKLQALGGSIAQPVSGFEVDLAALTPAPVPPPDEAHRW